MLKRLTAAALGCAILALPAVAQTTSAGEILTTLKQVYDYSQYRHHPNVFAHPDRDDPGRGAQRGAGVQNRPHHVAQHNPNYYPNYSMQGPLDVVFTNVAQGQAVPAVFNLLGQTAPRAAVKYTLFPRSYSGSTVTGRTRADRAGRFAVEVDVRKAPLNSVLALQAQATDSHGNHGPSRVVEVRRR